MLLFSLLGMRRLQNNQNFAGLNIILVKFVQRKKRQLNIFR